MFISPINLTYILIVTVYKVVLDYWYSNNNKLQKLIIDVIVI